MSLKALNKFMHHLPPIISDLALILVTAAVALVIFRYLRLPVILGYMAAGVLVGPHSKLLPTVTDTSSVNLWAELGVIFMLFAIGIEFSFKKLKSVGSTAFTTGLVQTGAMIVIGYFLGLGLGLSKMASIFFGATLSISSTTIILKTFEELHLKSKKFAQNVIGILIVEDLVAILLMVFLTTMTVSKEFEGTELLLTSGKLVFMITLWFVVGVFMIPWALKSAKKYLTDETLLVVAVGLCLMMVVGATSAGFSAALGAFLMGSIIGESEEKHRIEKLLLPVKDLFSAIFFVSVGMLIDPQALMENPSHILIVTLVLIAGKLFFVMFGSLISGESFKNSTYAGVSLAQIGEFSFIIATLGKTLNVTDDGLYSMVVAVSAITSLTTPFMIKYREQIHAAVMRIVPKRTQVALGQYSNASHLMKATPEWRGVIKNHTIKILLNSIVIVAIFLLSSRFVLPMLQQYLQNENTAKYSTLILAILFASPFVWGLVFAHSRDAKLHEFIQHSISKRLRQLFLLCKALLALFLIVLLVAEILDLKHASWVSVGVTCVMAVALYRFLGPIYLWFENKFVTQLDGDEGHHEQPKLPSLAPWDAHLAEFTIPPEIPWIAKPLIELGLREKFGVIIAMIVRGTRRIPAPGRGECLMPYDEVFVIGTDEQLEKFQHFIESEAALPPADPAAGHYSLEQYLVTEKSPFLGKIIRESGIRETTQGLVVGVERAGKRILNPDSALIIETGDLLWLVGDRAKIRSLS